MATNITLAQAAVLVDEMWTPELNDAVEFNFNIIKTFDDRSDQLPHGDRLNLPAIHHLTTGAKAADTALTPISLTETEDTFTVSTHRAVAIRVEDIAEIQAKYEVRANYTDSMSYGISRDMETDAAGVIDNNTLQTIGTLGTELTDDNLLRAWQYLEDSAAPSNNRFLVLSPAGAAGVMKLDKFASRLYVPDARVSENAEVGPVYRAALTISNLTVGTAPNSDGSMHHKLHFFKIMQRAPTVHSWYSPLDLAWVVSVDSLYGVFERNEADEAAGVTTRSSLWGVRLRNVK